MQDDCIQDYLTVVSKSNADVSSSIL